MSRPFKYLTSNLSPDIDWLSVENMFFMAVPVELSELERKCRTPLIEQHLGYGPGNLMANDPDIKCFRSIYLGQSCYYIEKQGTQYIFVEP